MLLRDDGLVDGVVVRLCGDTLPGEPDEGLLLPGLTLGADRWFVLVFGRAVDLVLALEFEFPLGR